ncbi:MAG TPA: GntR family transcriptional regulator [Sphaerochaeta sp.]|nr:GntR family transcriptional regulator [Sphaerochaeta sp.]
MARPIRETKTTMIASQLEQMIIDKTFESGSFLPSQKDLADYFNTSSRPVREALKLLEAKGLVIVSQGRRAEVVNTSLTQYIDSISTTIMNSTVCPRKLIRNLVQVQVAVATSAVRDFSRNEGRSRYLSQLYRTVYQMESALPAIAGKEQDEGLARFYDAEATFHRSLIRASNNQILVSIYESMAPTLEETISTIKFSYQEIEKRTRDYSYLCDALENGQTDLAVALVLVALTSMENTILETYPDESEPAANYA